RYAAMVRKPCEQCGTDYEPYRSTQRFCDNLCRYDARAERLRDAEMHSSVARTSASTTRLQERRKRSGLTPLTQSDVLRLEAWQEALERALRATRRSLALQPPASYDAVLVKGVEQLPKEHLRRATHFGVGVVVCPDGKTYVAVKVGREQSIPAAPSRSTAGIDPRHTGR
ncbi:hypothetical protein, partial [Dokdonella sp.]|uniref:hypothetical protein n=1 Tax=Dokdonella sp. TaxID=2291710 RepID=UPI002DD6A23D